MSEPPDEWEEAGRSTYFRVYSFLVVNQAVVKHPKAPMVAPEYWQTIAHNAAFLAAEFAEGGDLTVDDEDGNMLATSVDGTLQ